MKAFALLLYEAFIFKGRKTILLNKSGVGPEDLYFYQAPRGG